MDLENYYQLALVDLKEDGTFDDKIVSNKGDRDTVLATIFQILNYFLTIVPDVVVLFAGSTDSRTRLYQIALNSELERHQKILIYQDSIIICLNLLLKTKLMKHLR